MTPKIYNPQTYASECKAIIKAQEAQERALKQGNNDAYWQAEKDLRQARGELWRKIMAHGDQGGWQDD